MHIKAFRLGWGVVVWALAALAGAAPGNSAQLALVTQLYQTYAFEATIQQPYAAPAFLDSSRASLLRFLTPELTALLLADRQCAAASHQICKLDFSPLWASQDPSGTVVSIVPTPQADRVKVELRDASGQRTLLYHLVGSASRWRIQDIEYAADQGTLLGILKAK